MKVDKGAAGMLRQMIGQLSRGGIGLEDGEHARAWGLLDNGAHVKLENFKVYSEFSKKAYERTCKSHFNFAEFEGRVVGAFSEAIAGNVAPSDEDIRVFLSAIEQEETFKFLVAREVHGLRLAKVDEGALKLGPFGIYHYPSHKDLAPFGVREDRLFWEDGVQYLVGVDVEAKTAARAIEKADELFEAFEKTVRFMAGPSRNYDVSVLRAEGGYSQRAYLFSEGQPYSQEYKYVGRVHELPIDDEYFRHPELGFGLLWEEIGKSTTAPLRLRISKSTQWLAEAYYERDSASAFIKAAIALEVLLVANQGAIITPSITASISEAVACLLGEDVEDRITIESRLKKWYGVRSAIAHSGKTDVDLGAFEEFAWTVRRSILRLLNAPSLRDLATVEELHEYLKRLKYSFQTG